MVDIVDYPDPVVVFLQSQGCSRAVIEGGLSGLVTAWEQVIDRVAGEYAEGLEDFLNDMDKRELLNEAWQVARDDQRAECRDRLEAADRRMRDLLLPADHCLYGDVVAEAEGWTPEVEWWYFGVPARAGPRLRSELKGGAGPEAGR